jgi:hypothetical protein
MSISITSFLHHHGVNLRYIGNVMKHLPPTQSSFNDTLNVDSTIQFGIWMLGMEATARAIKNQMNESLREKMTKVRLPLEVIFLLIISKSKFFEYSLGAPIYHKTLIVLCRNIIFILNFHLGPLSKIDC